MEEQNKFETNFSTITASRRRINFKNPFSSRPNFSPRSLRFNQLNNLSRKHYLIAGIVILVLLALFGIYKFSLSKAQPSSQTATGQKIQIPDAKATQNINKEFTFPIKDDKGNQLSTIKFIVDTVEKRDVIVVKGTPATAVAGRTFLIINLKIVNDYNQSIQINTKDYIRLTLNGNESESLAPEINNDPVEVQAISTKLTRVGFAINDTDKKLQLHVGEIKGDKTTVDLNI